MIDTIQELTINDPLSMAMGVYLDTTEANAALDYKFWTQGLLAIGKSNADAAMLVVDDLWKKVYFPYLHHGDGEIVMDQLVEFDPSIKEGILDIIDQIDRKITS